ncbi:MAG TPA: SDR family oxidoreductase [Bacteroidales bacterium]|nr:SDR family oxidoreductase [Bacteroidales bacterium]
MTKKTVVITGSTRGIGNGMAMQFLKRGHQVVINGRNSEGVESMVRKLKDKGFDVSGEAGDIFNPETHKRLTDNAVSTFGKIDIWINNAGIPQTNILFHELTDDEIEKLVSANVTGMMYGSKAALNFFKEQGYGKLFNMEGFGSDGRIMKKLSLYGTSKRAVNYFTKAVSKEVDEKTIQIGALNPGMVRTDFIKDSMHTGSKEEQAKTKRVFDILGEDVVTVTEFLVNKILKSQKQYDKINYLTLPRFLPKLIKLIFVN